MTASSDGFRPGEDFAAPERPQAEPAVLGFSEAANAGGTDFDVLMGYQLLLGRDPENSFVIANAKNSPVGAFIRALLESGEFQSAVVEKMHSGGRLPHETGSAAPSARQRDWLFRHLTLPRDAEIMLRTAPGWREWMRVLLAVPGMPGRQREAAAAKAAPAGHTTPADEGFVLIQLEQPKPGDTLQPGMRVNGSGWTIAPADVTEVAILVDGTLLTHARYGLPRPDVARGFPHYRHVDHCGFTFVADIPPGLAVTEASRLVVRVRSARGDEGEKGVRLLPPPALPLAAATAGSAGGEAWPMRLSIEEALIDEGRVLRLRGWAVARAGIGTLSVSLGETELAQATTGLSRPDIARANPDYPDAGRAGFVLVHGLDRGLAPGPNFVRVQATDARGQTRQVSAPVTVPAADLPPGTPRLPMPRGGKEAAADLRLELDRPVLEGDEARDALQGALSISGWAVARPGIAGISVFFDGDLLGTAHMGMRREDIGAAFPDFPGSLLAGYALVLPPGALPEGRHEIRVVATAKSFATAPAKSPTGAPAATAECRFFLKVDPYHAVPPGGEPRVKIPPAEVALGESLLAQADFSPVFTVLLEAGTSSPAALARSLASLSAQVYPAWTARIFGPEAALALPEAADPSGRIGFAGATRRRAKPATTGQPHYLVKLRAGDRLGADAFLELALALALADDRAADLLYGDDLRFDPGQQRNQPFFKPDFSPEFLLAMNYPGRAWCVAATLVETAGFTQESLAAAGDYEAVLRLAEKALKIVHLPRVLWALGGAGDTPAAEQAALTAALKRRKLRAAVSPGSIAGTWRVRRRFGAALVSIIMPSCSARGLVRRAIASVRATTAPARPEGARVEIIVLDNTPASQKADRAWLRKNADIVVDMPGPFNWSRFNNLGAAAAHGAYLLFLNDDIEISQPDWLEVLLEQAARPEVGVVGARLLYPAGTVQHAGQYLADGHARHAFRFADAKMPGPFGLATVTREVIAVTGACQLMQRRVFDRLGGYDEAHSIVNNDLDFCLRSWQAGLAVIYTPHATLIHHELASRAKLDDIYDAARFSGAWRQVFLQGDPFRNPHLGQDSDHYGPEPEPSAWLHAGRRGPPIERIRRILAVKLDHIGDFLTALPALQALAAQFPEAAIDLLVPGATAALARQGGMLPASLPIGDVSVFDFFHARSGEGRKQVGEAELAALHTRLAPKAYDLAIDLRMHPETRPVLRHTGARFLAGYDHEDRYPWLDVALEWEGDVRLVRKRAHVSERLVQLVSAVAAACTRPAVAPAVRGRRMAARKHAASEAFAALPAAFRARPVVCIHPGVGNVVRQWPAASFAALIDLLAERPGLHAVLIGSTEEAPIADEIMRKVADPSGVESLVGKVKLAELPDLMRQCALFVGNNSGPQHLAASLGMRALGIHSGVVDATEWAPLGARSMAIRRRMVCSPCYLEFASDCPRDLACLTGLPAHDVHAACLRLLAGGALKAG